METHDMPTVGFCFNPSHEETLAKGKRHTLKPQIEQFERDCAEVLRWIHEGQERLINLHERHDKTTLQDIVRVKVWGKNRIIRERLLKMGIPQKALWDVAEDDIVKMLQCRASLEAFYQHLKAHGSRLNDPLGMTLRDIEEVVEIGKQHESIVVKALWGSSGRGIEWIKDGNIKEAQRARIGKWMREMGGVWVETARKKENDYAMEIDIRGGEVRNIGLSKFVTTENGMYKGNVLMSNEDIEDELKKALGKTYWASEKHAIVNAVKDWVGTMYSGNIGIDMLVYTENGRKKLHPAVEINARHTMGEVARIIYDRYCEKGVVGEMLIRHHDTTEDAKRYDEDMKNTYPLVKKSDKITAGYMPLTTIGRETKWTMGILINETQNAWKES